MHDLVVAGGGPIGLATALYAVRAGLDVTVRERRSGVIDKACGEGLMPGAVSALADLGVHPSGHRLAGIRYLGGDKVAEAPFRELQGLGVRRTALHEALLRRAAQSGVVPLEQPVTDVTDAGDHVLVDGVPARYLVAADGLHSPVRRLVGLDSSPSRRRRFGQRAHVRCAPWTDFVEVHWASSGEAYVTPVGEAQVGIAVLSDVRRPLADHLVEFPTLAPRIAGLELSRVRGAGPLRQAARRRTAGRVLLVGDASGYVDALTGEGIAIGLAHARAAVDAIVADDPASYEQTWRRIGRRHELLTRALLGASRVPPVRRHLVGAAALLPGVFTAVVDQLARPA